MRIDSLLETQPTACEQRLELVLRNTVQQRNLLGDLMNGLLQGWELVLGFEIGSRLEVHADDADAIAELLDILSGGCNAVVVIEIAESTEHTQRGLSAECHDKSLFLRALNVKDLDNWAGSGDS